MKELTEPWKNLRQADRYLEKNDVAWRTVSSTFLAFLAYILLLSVVNKQDPAEDIQTLSINLRAALGMAGFALFIKAFRNKDNAELKSLLGRRIRYTLTLLLGFAAVLSTTVVVAGSMGGVGRSGFAYIMMGAFVFLAYLPYKVFSLTKKQGALVALLWPVPVAQWITFIYLIYWWAKYGRER